MRQVQTFPGVVSRFAQSTPDHIALKFGSRITTYADMHEHCRRLAAAMQAAGVERGTRVGYLGKNSDRFFELLIAVAQIGAVLVPIGWRLSPAEVTVILEDAACRMVFVDATGLPLFLEASSDLHSVPKAVTIDVRHAGFDDYEEILTADHPLPTPEGAAGPEDRFLQLYTSGTTGKPKGVVLCQRNFFAMRRPRDPHAKARWDQWDADDIALLPMPVAHISGTGLGMLALYAGATCVIAREFIPSQVLSFIEQEGVNRIFLVPSALRIILEDPRARTTNFSRMRSICYGASPIPLDLLREAVEVFGCGFVQTYGMTETTGSVTCLPEEDHCLEGTPRMGSVGRAMEGVELQVVDSTGREVPTGQVGEVLIRCTANMLEYWNRPEATQETLSSDGWLRTGDAGYLDEDGYLFLHDRVKDMIITGGENVYPAEVENAIFGHPAVREVAVIGLAHDRWGEAVTAVVVLHANARCSQQEICDWARARVASFKVPKAVHFVDALPLNASGKVLRRKLRDAFATVSGALERSNEAHPGSKSL